MRILILGGPGAEIAAVGEMLGRAGVPLADAGVARRMSNQVLGTNDEHWWEFADVASAGTTRGDVGRFNEEVSKYGAELGSHFVLAEKQVGLALSQWVEAGAAFDLVIVMVRDFASAAEDLAEELGVSHAAAVGLVELYYRLVGSEVSELGLREEVVRIDQVGLGGMLGLLGGLPFDQDQARHLLGVYSEGLWRAPVGRAEELLNASQRELFESVCQGNLKVSRAVSFGGASALASLALRQRRERANAVVIGDQAGAQYQLERTLFKAARFQQKQAETLLGWLVKAEGHVSRLLKSSRWKLGSLVTLNLKEKNSYPPLQGVFESVDKWREKQEDLLDPPDLWRSAEARVGSPLAPDQPYVEVVVPIHNALEDVRRCLSSVAERSGKLMRRLILVDDGSDAPTREFLAAFTRRVRFPVTLIENVEAGGYTRAANQGMRASQADIVVLLNSDTIVPGGWIERIVACAESGESGESEEVVGVVGALSNAASWQSVPERFSPEGDWMVNDLPEGMGVEDFAHLLARHHQASYPRVPLVNGFCMAIRREVIRKIGYFDEEAFPKGYGEENDFCFRAKKAGFLLAIADDLYVFHAKSKSYSNERRKELSKASGQVLHARYGKELQEVQVDLKESAGLEAARVSAREVAKMEKPLRVLYLATFRGTGGGTHSIVQEAAGLDRMGVLVEIAVRDRDLGFYLERYPSVPAYLFTPYAERSDLILYASRFEVVIGTLFTTMRILRDIVDANPKILPAYYIQDYEPMFFSAADPYYREALESYTLVPEAVPFAKTEWLRSKIAAEHGIAVEAVVASIDTDVYLVEGARIDGDGPKDGGLTVCAMVRPDSPRRSPEATLAVLRRLAAAGHRAVAFGSDAGDAFYAENDSTGVEVFGLVPREGVAEVLRSSDVFLDLSTYQAFGRTGLEAMSCGCIAVLPKDGGASEYVENGKNGFLIDTADEDGVVDLVDRLARDAAMRESLRAQGLETASRYSIDKAALSVEALLRKKLSGRAAENRPLCYG